MGSVWKVRNKEWVFLPASGSFKDVMLIWYSNKFSCSKMVLVLGSFTVTIKLGQLKKVLFGSPQFMVLVIPTQGRISGWNFKTFLV